MFGQAGSSMPKFAESVDGVNFTNVREVSVAGGRFDTHKNVVFDPVTRKWVAYIRCRYLSPMYVLLLPLVWQFPLRKGNMGATWR